MEELSAATGEESKKLSKEVKKDLKAIEKKAKHSSKEIAEETMKKLEVLKNQKGFMLNLIA